MKISDFFRKIGKILKTIFFMTEPPQFRITTSKSFTTRGLYRFLKKCEKLSPDKKGPTQSYGFNSSIEYRSFEKFEHERVFLNECF